MLTVPAVLSSALRNVLMRRKRTTTDFFINPPFASGRTRTCGIIAVGIMRTYLTLEHLLPIFFK